MKNTKRKTKEERISESELQEQNDILFSCQIEKSKFKKLIKKQSDYCVNVKIAGNQNILKSIHFELENDVLTMVSTDANRMLKTQIKVYESQKNGQGNYDGVYLGKIGFIKNLVFPSRAYVDMLELNFKKECLQIKDIANGIEYNVPRVYGEYPNWKNLFPEENADNSKEYTTYGVNIRYLEQLKNLSPNTRNNILKLRFKKRNVLAPIVAECTDGDLKTSVIVMPIQLRGKDKD